MSDPTPFWIGGTFGIVVGICAGYGLGYNHCRLLLRAIVSDECGKEAAKRVFGEKPAEEGTK